MKSIVAEPGLCPADGAAAPSPASVFWPARQWGAGVNRAPCRACGRKKASRRQADWLSLAGTGFFAGISPHPDRRGLVPGSLRFEGQGHVAQVFARLHQHQRAGVGQHDRLRLARYVHRLGLGCDGRLHLGHFGGV
jgi:hypothetical protein